MQIQSGDFIQATVDGAVVVGRARETRDGLEVVTLGGEVHRVSDARPAEVGLEYAPARAPRYPGELSDVSGWWPKAWLNGGAA